MLVCLSCFLGALLFAAILGSWREAFNKAVTHLPALPVLPAGGMVSLVVPARDAATTLLPLLQDLHAQQWPKEQAEVLVVDDGSSDGTAALVRGMMRSWPGLRLIQAQGTGKKAAIAQGTAEAAGEWVVLTDADARCGPLRLRCLMEHVVRRAPDLVLMPVDTQAGSGAVQWLQEEEQRALMGVAAGMALTGAPYLANGANMAFRKTAFQAVGGYTGDRWAGGDDVFLVQRMRQAGKTVDYLLAPEVLVTVQAEPTWALFLRQRMRWAGKMRGLGGLAGWGALAGLLLPWFMAGAGKALVLGIGGGGDPLEALSLLAGAWMLWLLPVLALAKAVRGFLRVAGVPVRGRGGAMPTMVAFLAFTLYAPAIAATSLFVRPLWKGRRT